MKYPFEVSRFIGINRDLPPSELPLDVFSDGKNIRYDNLAMCKFDGHSQIFDVGMLHTPYHALGVRKPLDYFWIYGGTNAVGVVNTSGTHNDITPVSAPSATYENNWHGGVINGVPYLNYPGGNPIFWDGITTIPMVTLTGWPASTSTKCIRTYRNFLVALDLTESSIDYPNRVRWSASATSGLIPQSWDETDPTIDAGFVTLGGTQGAVVDCLPLYENNIVYKNNSAFIMSFIGGQQIFSFRELFQDIGVIGRDCVVYFKGRHAVFTQDDLIVHDGRTPQSIIDKKMRSWLFREIDPEHATKSFITPYHKKDELWFCFTNASAGANGLPNTALVWNYKDDKLSVRDIQDAPFIAHGVISQFDGVADWDSDTESWDSDTSVWNESQIGSVTQDLVMCSGSNLHQIDIGATFNGVDYESYVERLSIPLGDNYTEVKMLRSMWPYIEGPPGTVLNIRVGSQMHLDDPISWADDGVYTLGTDDRFNSFIKGRLISFKISSQTGAKWVLHGIGLEVKSAERY